MTATVNVLSQKMLTFLLAYQGFLNILIQNHKDKQTQMKAGRQADKDTTTLYERLRD